MDRTCECYKLSFKIMIFQRRIFPTGRLILHYFHFNLSKQELHKWQPFFNSVGDKHAYVHMLLYASSSP